MKYFLAFCLVVGVVSAAYVKPPNDPFALILREQRQYNIFESTRNIIENLVGNLRKAAQDAREAIGSFTTSVQNEAKQIREKIANDVQRLRDRVSVAIDNVSDKLIDSGVGIVGCVATSREEAAVLFNVTLTKSLACVDDRINEITAQIEGLSTIAANAVEFSNQVVEDMRQCTTDNGNILSIGACLGNVAVQAEMKVAVFATQSAVTIGRISLSLATLPAALEVCAGTRLVETGISTTKIIMEMGSCSASAVYAGMSGNDTENSDQLTTINIPLLTANFDLTNGDQTSNTAQSPADLLTTNVETITTLPSNEPVILRQ